jgi:hypothetical protein
VAARAPATRESHGLFSKRGRTAVERSARLLGCMVGAGATDLCFRAPSRHAGTRSLWQVCASGPADVPQWSALPLHLHVLWRLVLRHRVGACIRDPARPMGRAMQAQLPTDHTQLTPPRRAGRGPATPRFPPPQTGHRPLLARLPPPPARRCASTTTCAAHPARSRAAATAAQLATIATACSTRVARCVCWVAAGGRGHKGLLTCACSPSHARVLTPSPQPRRSGAARVVRRRPPVGGPEAAGATGRAFGTACSG